MGTPKGTSDEKHITEKRRMGTLSCLGGTVHSTFGALTAVLIVCARRSKGLGLVGQRRHRSRCIGEPSTHEELRHVAAGQALHYNRPGVQEMYENYNRDW
jgi:hypothetical protein